MYKASQEKQLLCTAWHIMQVLRFSLHHLHVPDRLYPEYHDSAEKRKALLPPQAVFRSTHNETVKDTIPVQCLHFLADPVCGCDPQIFLRGSEWRICGDRELQDDICKQSVSSGSRQHTSVLRSVCAAAGGIVSDHSSPACRAEKIYADSEKFLSSANGNPCSISGTSVETAF